MPPEYAFVSTFRPIKVLMVDFQKKVLKINSNAGENAIQFNGVQIWNNLLPEWKNFPFYKFKRFM